MALPTVIQGPAWVIWNSFTFYTEGAVTVSYRRDNWTPKSAQYGSLGPRMRAMRTTVGFKPAGEIKAGLAKYFPYGPSTIETVTKVSSIGSSIFNGALQVVPLNGSNMITFPKAGMTRSPRLTLKPSATALGDIEFTTIGDPSVAPTNPAFWQTLASGSPDPKTFDPTKVISPVYTFTWDALSAVDCEDGIEIDIAVHTKDMMSGNYGLVDIIVEDVEASATMVPIGVDEAAISTALKLQGSDALLPGANLGITGKDLTIAASGIFTAVLKQAGPTGGEFRYDIGTFRQGAMQFATRKTFTAGVPDPIFTLALS